MSRAMFKLPKSCLKFSRTNKNGQIIKFRWELLPEHRWEEFVDFKMNFFVKHEITHVVAGIYKQPKAMEEYKQIAMNQLKDPSLLPIIYCVDNDIGEILVIDAMKLYKKGDIYVDVEQAKTAEMKRFYKILHEWNKLCPVPDIMAKYDVETYFDDAGVAVHPLYRGYGITHEVSTLRGLICKENNVPLAGAWHTSVATQKASDKNEWETVYEISYKDLEKILKITFDNPPPTFQYKVKKFL